MENKDLEVHKILEGKLTFAINTFEILHNGSSYIVVSKEKNIFYKIKKDIPGLWSRTYEQWFNYVCNKENE